jgi:hypothetical protein
LYSFTEDPDLALKTFPGVKALLKGAKYQGQKTKLTRHKRYLPIAKVTACSEPKDTGQGPKSQ